MQREGMESGSQPSLFVLQLLGHTIELHRDLHRLTIDGHRLDFSRTDCALMELLMYYARDPGEFAPSASLSKQLRGQQAHLRRLLSRRISDMRTKLWPFGLDILNVGDLGYILTHKLVPVHETFSEIS